MGQKVNPIGFRVGIVRDWDSRWFADRKNAEYLKEDADLRVFLKNKLSNAGLSRVLIERVSRKVTITVHVSRPGVVIGAKGADIEKLRQQLMKRLQGDVSLNVVEIKRPDLSAVLVAQSIANQLERRVSFRRALKRGVQLVLKAGALGVRAKCSGRLGGADIARSEEYREGSIPLHTLRADIDYALAEAKTTYGVIGVKVWIYKGLNLSKSLVSADENILKKDY